MADDNLQIRVTADVADLQSQMKVAANSVRSAATEMDSGTDSAAAGFRAMESAGVRAGEATAVSMRESRAAIMEVNKELDLGLNRHLAGYLTTLPGVGAAMTAAFSGVMVIGLIEVITKAAEKVKDYWEQLGKLTEAQQKAFETARTQAADLLKAEEKNITANYEAEIAKAKGLDRDRLRLQELTALTRVNQTYLGQLEEQANKLREQAEAQRKISVEAEARAKTPAVNVGEALGNYGGLGALTTIHLAENAVASYSEEWKKAQAAIADAEQAFTHLGAEQATVTATMQQRETQITAHKLAEAYKRFAAGQEFHKRQVEEAKRAADEQERLNEEGTRIWLEINKKSLDEWHKQVQASIAKLEGDLKAVQNQFGKQEDTVRGKGARGEISKVDEIQQLRDLHQQELEEEARYVRQMLDLEKLIDDPVRAAQRQAQLDDITAKADRQKNADTQAVLTAQQQRYQQFLTTVSQGFTTALNGWLQGTQTFGQAMTHTWQSLAMDAIQYIEQLGAKWITTHVLMAAANAVFHKEAAAQEVAGDAAKQAITSTTNVATATSDAAVSAAGTLAYYSAFAPEIAPAMAAAQYAIGMGLAGMAAFDLGGVVPRTQVALVHGGERVLTGMQNSVFERLIAQGDRGGFSAGENHFHAHGVSDPVNAARINMRMFDTRIKRMARDRGHSI